MKCVCSGCTPCYIGVYQCGLWSIVQVCLCGDWRFVLTWLWEGCVAEVRGGGLRCWGLCVFVISVQPLHTHTHTHTHTFILSHSLQCRKPYAATQLLMLLIMSICARNMSSEEYINKITLLHQVDISLYFMRKMHGQTTLKLSVRSSLFCDVSQLRLVISWRRFVTTCLVFRIQVFYCSTLARRGRSCNLYIGECWG